MEIFLSKDVPHVGIAGQIVKVKPGYAYNFIIPRSLGVIITSGNKEFYSKKAKKPKDPQAIHSATSLLAEKIGDVSLKLKKKMHDDGKLYASIRSAEVVQMLADKGFKIDKSQVKFSKTIKEKGAYKVTIKLSSKLQPIISLTVSPE